MNTSKRQKLFFLFIFLFSFNIFCLAIFPGSALGSEDKVIKWNNITVDKQWLIVEAGNFIDNTEGDGSGRIGTAYGGKKLIEFKNQEAIMKDGNAVAFPATAVFVFDAFAYSKVLPEHVIKSGNLHKKKSVEWVKIHKFASTGIGKEYNDYTPISGNIEYYECVVNDMYTHDYLGGIPIDVSIKQDFAGRDISLNGYTIKNLKVYTEIRDIVVSGYRANEISEYKDFFDGYDSISENAGGVDTLPTSLGTGDKKSEVETHLEDLGIQERIDSGEKTLAVGGKSGQSVTDGESIGQTWSNPESKNSMSFTMRCEVKPEITMKKEIIEYTWGEIRWDYKNELLSPSVVILDDEIDRSVDRVKAIHVYNKMVRNRFKVEVNFIAEGQLEGELGGDELGEPVQEIGDFIWDDDFTGDSGYTLNDPDGPLEKFFRELGAWATGLLITIIIIITIAVVGYLLLKSLGTVAIKEFANKVIGGN